MLRRSCSPPTARSAGWHAPRGARWRLPAMAERLTRIVVAHPKKVAIGWFAMLVLAMAASHTANPRYVNNLALPGTDSQRATDLLRRELPAQSGDTDQIVLHATTGLITDPAVRTRVSPMFAHLSRLPHVTGVATPF